MSADDSDRPFRRRICDAIDSAPGPAPFPADRLKTPSCQDVASSGADRRRRPWLAAAAVLVVVLVALGGTWGALSGDDRVDVVSDSENTGTAELANGEREVVTYTQSYELDCPDGQIARSGQFDSLTIETTGSTELQRWKQTVTYPDGSSRVLLHVGSPWYPTESFAAGEPRGQVVGCAASGVLLSEPSPTAVFMLNPLAAVPETPGGSPAVPQYDDLGEQMPGNQIGRAGRPVELWRQSISGSRSFGAKQVPLEETTEWLVDPGTSKVVQQTFRQSYDGIGTIRWTATLESFSSEQLDMSDLAEDGMQQQEVDSGSAPGATPTTSLAGD